MWIVSHSCSSLTDHGLVEERLRLQCAPPTALALAAACAHSAAGPVRGARVWGSRPPPPDAPVPGNTEEPWAFRVTFLEDPFQRGFHSCVTPPSLNLPPSPVDGM